MLAHPTPQQAFPGRYQRITDYLAQNPCWYQWSRTGDALWQARQTLDPSGLTVATQIAHVAAYTLDTLMAGAPAHVGVWRTLGPAVTAAWQTWRHLAQRTPPATPTQTVRLTPGAQGALQALQAWDPVRQHNVPGQPGALLVTLLQGTSVVAAPSSNAVAPPQVRLHVLTANDTLVQLATRFLGDPEAWPQIAALNRLRHPYLSPRLWDQWGPPVAAFECTNAANVSPFVAAPPVDAGSTTVTLPGVSAAVAVPGTVIVLEQWTATGRQQEAHAVIAYDGSTFVATFAEPVAASYGPGALMSLNWPAAWQTTQVLSPGATIQIPLPGAAPTPLVAQPTDPLGTDWYVDDAGQLQWTATGDIMTATGLQNLAGALARRLNTTLGTLPLHPQYGSALATVIGSPIAASYVLKGYVKTALQADPRVTAILGITATPNPTRTQWAIVAQVQVPSWPYPIPVSTVLGGG